MRISLPEIETQHMAKEVLLTIKHVFAGIAVADYDSAFAWYKRLFGRLPDVIVSENESMWQVADAGWIYVVGDTTRAGSALLTLLVDDLEDHVAELRERGLETSAIETAPGLYRKAVITDPEGNMISFGEDLSQDA
jgi:predicted enzyme related to lactoylglutathione lyase